MKLMGSASSVEDLQNYLFWRLIYCYSSYLKSTTSQEAWGFSWGKFFIHESRDPVDSDCEPKYLFGWWKAFVRFPDSRLFITTSFCVLLVRKTLGFAVWLLSRRVRSVLYRYPELQVFLVFNFVHENYRKKIIVKDVFGVQWCLFEWSNLEGRCNLDYYL